MITVRFRSLQALYSVQISMPTHVKCAYQPCCWYCGIPFRRTRDYIQSRPLEDDCVVEGGHLHLPYESCPDLQLPALCNGVGNAPLQLIKVQ